MQLRARAIPGKSADRCGGGRRKARSGPPRGSLEKISEWEEMV